LYRSVRSVSSLPQTLRTPTDGDAVRRRILDAAEHVFAERGYAGATTREIALEADIRKRMLFYYFPTKAVLYHAVLERIVMNLVAIHERFRDEPGPIGLGEAAEALTAFAAANLGALKLLHREIMDAGPHLAGLARTHLRPLFARGAEEVERNMMRGNFRRGDPMHTLVNVGGLTLYYFLLVPLLRLLWDRDPLAPEALIERAAVVRDWLMYGLADPADRGEISS
jgi:TetR/AcrR family transcriptional regulator